MSSHTGCALVQVSGGAQSTRRGGSHPGLSALGTRARTHTHTHMHTHDTQALIAHCVSQVASAMGQVDARGEALVKLEGECFIAQNHWHTWCVRLTAVSGTLGCRVRAHLGVTTQPYTTPHQTYHPDRTRRRHRTQTDQRGQCHEHARVGGVGMRPRLLVYIY